MLRVKYISSSWAGNPNPKPRQAILVNVTRTFIELRINDTGYTTKFRREAEGRELGTRGDWHWSKLCPGEYEKVEAFTQEHGAQGIYDRDPEKQARKARKLHRKANRKEKV